MEDRRRLPVGLLLTFLCLVCAVVARGSRLKYACSLNENRASSLDITCSNQQEDFVGVGCTKEERVKIPRGYRYIPGYGLYRLYSTAHFWSKARDMCRQDGGRLAVPRDGDVAATLWELFRQDAYVGISDTDNEGVFMDVDGKLPPYLRWSPGEPNGARDENCVALYRGGVMNDVNCNRGFYFLCERPLASPLPHGYEFLDNFGFYKIHTDKATFEKAEGVCGAEGGHLFLLETYEEAEAVAALVKRQGANLGALWTGLNDTASEGDFVTFTGRSVDDLEFRNWGYGEPNNDHGGENCAAFLENGALNDEVCNLKFNFICEIPP